MVKALSLAYYLDLHLPGGYLKFRIRPSSSYLFQDLFSNTFKVVNTINHALWGATIGRSVGLPVEGAIAGALPDLVTLPEFIYLRLARKMNPEQAPKMIIGTYSLLHNWIFGLVGIAILFLVKPEFGLVGLCYFWHIFEDAFLHTKMATRFLYPLWGGKIQKYSASEHKWVQVVDFGLIVLANVIISKITQQA